MIIRIVCPHDHGSTVEPRRASNCPFCLGLASATTIAPPSGYFHSVDILDCINFAEFNALGDNNKASVKLIISAGYVNMNEGSAAGLKLFMCFPEGTATCTALLALIA